uniref:Uncharacterized protein n=1 Tax=Panagrolaimus davidi TaxID=227884 RepID=A0A914PBE4_9BILA
MSETDVEFESSSPPTSTARSSVPSTSKTKSTPPSSLPPSNTAAADNESDLPCLSSDFEISKLNKNSPKKKKKHRTMKRNTPSPLNFRKISQTTTTTRTRTISETFSSTSENGYTSSIPTSRTFAQTDVKIKTSSPPTSTSRSSLPSTPKAIAAPPSSSLPSTPAADNESNLSTHSSNFEIFPNKNGSPSPNNFRKISQSTSITETRTVTETFSSTNGSTSSIPTSRTFTQTSVINGNGGGSETLKPISNIPKTWKRRKSPKITFPPELGNTSSSTSLVSLASQSVTSKI